MSRDSSKMMSVTLIKFQGNDQINSPHAETSPNPIPNYTQI